MDEVELRRYVSSLYKGPKWVERVKKMSDSQVSAIYMAKQQFEKEKKEEKKRT